MILSFQSRIFWFIFARIYLRVVKFKRLDSSFWFVGVLILLKLTSSFSFEFLTENPFLPRWNNIPVAVYRAQPRLWTWLTFRGRERHVWWFLVQFKEIRIYFYQIIDFLKISVNYFVYRNRWELHFQAWGIDFQVPAAWQAFPNRSLRFEE